MDSARPQLQATLSGEIHLKSARVRARFADAVCRNVEQALGDAQVREISRGRLVVDTSVDFSDAADRVSRVFGIRAIEEVVPVPFPDLDRGVAAVAQLTREMVADRRFAVRCRRTGTHDFRSNDVERRLGAALLPHSAGVDLSEPEVTVRLRLDDDTAWATRRRRDGPSGLPLGVEGHALVLLSGGYDSAVAAWRMMSRGVTCQFLHLTMACSQRDQALAVAHHLWSGWGAGMAGTVHVLDFGPVRRELLDNLRPRHRQVALKKLMLDAGDGVAEALGIEVLVTGEALGQVSSQTFSHLASLDRVCERPLIRPLLTFSKEEIITEARSLGVAELSERAGEACDLSEGHRVETSMSARSISAVARRVSDDALEAAIADWRIHDLSRWLPGSPGESWAA